MPEEHADSIRAFIDEAGAAPFGSRVRIVLAEGMEAASGGVRGTYGVVRGAGAFLVGALDTGGGRCEDFGYLFEAVILGVTSLGYGTCWLGGTFSRGIFAEAVRLGPDEIIPAVSPVGVPAGRRSAVDRLIAAAAGSSSRMPFSRLFFRDGFDSPMNERHAGPYATALEMVRLAPSSSNRQPWRVLMRDGAFHFYLRRTPLYSLLFGAVDLQLVDMGIAMYHFERTCIEEGLAGTWRAGDPRIPGVPHELEHVVSFVP
jgi:nitroreductase